MTNNKPLLIVKPSLKGVDEFISQAEEAIEMVNRGLELLGDLQSVEIEIDYSIEPTPKD